MLMFIAGLVVGFVAGFLLTCFWIAGKHIEVEKI